MANFHNLPLGIHLKLADYLNVQDKISVSQSCRSVRILYRNASFKNTYITGYEKPRARMLIRTGDLGYTIRAIPFNVFAHPDNYQWFECCAIVRLMVGPESDSRWQEVIENVVGNTRYAQLKRVEFDFTLSAREIQKTIVPANTDLFKANLLIPAHFDHFFPSGSSAIPCHIVESLYYSLSQLPKYTPVNQSFKNLKLIVVRKLPIPYYENLVHRINETDFCQNLKLFVTYHWVNLSQKQVTIDSTIYEFAKIKANSFACHIEFFASNNDGGEVLNCPINLPQVKSIAFNSKISEEPQAEDVTRDPNVLAQFLQNLQIPSLKHIEDHRVLFLNDFTFDTHILGNITKLIFSPRIIPHYMYKHLPATFQSFKSLRELHFNVSSPQLNNGSQTVYCFGEMITEVFYAYFNRHSITNDYIKQKIRKKLSPCMAVNDELVDIITEAIFHPLSTRIMECDTSLIPAELQEGLSDFRVYEYIFLHLALLPRLEYLSLDYYCDTYPSLQLYYVLGKLKSIKQVFIRSSNNDWNRAPVPWIVTTLPFQELFPLETFRRYFPRDSGVCSYVIDFEQRNKYEPSLATAALNNIPQREYLMRNPRTWENKMAWAHHFCESMVEEFQGWL